MPRSKRNQKVSLTQVKKKGQEWKQKQMETVQAYVNKYQRVFVLTAHNMRTSFLQDVRTHWSHSALFFGKGSLMKAALGKGEEDEHLPGLHHVSCQLVGPAGLLFTDRTVKETLQFFKKFKALDYARSGEIATETVILPEGPQDFEHSSSIEPQLRQLGLPTSLVKGVVVLREDFTVCKKGDKLTPEQGRILKLFGHKMVHFHISVSGVWNKKTGAWEILKAQKKGKAKKLVTKAKEEEREEESIEDEEEEMSDT